MVKLIDYFTPTKFVIFMKYSILSLLLCCIGLFAYGQEAEVSPKLPVDPTTNKVTFAKIVEAPEVSSKDLLENAKKFLATKNTNTNPYTIKYENMEEGALIEEGTFTLPAERKKYMVTFTISINTKSGKYKYSITNFIIQHHTDEKSSYGGYGGWGSSSHKSAETLEYSLETFYPSRLTSKKPVIKFFEEIDEESFVTIHRELKSLAGALTQAMATKDNW